MSANFVIRNQTPTRLEVTHGDFTLKLAPLQQDKVAYDPAVQLGEAGRRARMDRALEWEREPVRSTRVLITAWLAVGSFVGLVVAVTSWLVEPGWRALTVGAAAAAALCALATVPLNRDRSGANPADPGTSPQPGTARGRGGWAFARDVAMGFLHRLALLLAIAVGLLAPAAAIYYGTELSAVVQVVNWGPDVSLVVDPADYEVIVARMLQMALVSVLATIPALMFFQFDRERLVTLIDRWVHQAFRLDPTLTTMADLDAKYGRRIEEFYGATFNSGVATASKRVTSRSPLFVATLLTAIGWLVVLLNPVDPSAGLTNVQRFIQPAYTPMTCAFLGAYFFCVQLVLLGYIRGDLRPKTYNMVSVRIVMAVILAWILQGLFGSPDWVLAASFLAGLVPDTVLRLVRDVPRLRQQRAAVQERAQGTDTTQTDRLDEFEDRSPLIALDGIGIYERTRLAEEGITSVQALARHDLVDLILSSRIPASRLVDWVDQALLFQHVTAKDRRDLRQVGVRTATELLAVSTGPGRAGLATYLDKGESRLPLILAGLHRDEWLSSVSYWRRCDATTEPGRTVYTDAGLQLTPSASSADLIPAQPTSRVVDITDPPGQADEEGAPARRARRRPRAAAPQPGPEES